MEYKELSQMRKDHPNLFRRLRSRKLYKRGDCIIVQNEHNDDYAVYFLTKSSEERVCSTVGFDHAIAVTALQNLIAYKTPLMLSLHWGASEVSSWEIDLKWTEAEIVDLLEVVGQTIYIYIRRQK